MVNLKDILELSVPERILMVEAIWDSIESDTRDNPDDWPLTQEQKEELLRRLQRYESGQSKSYTWEEVKAFAKE